MQDLNPQQKKLLRLAKLVDKKEIGVLEEIDSLDSKLKDVETKVEQAISIAEETQKMEGKAGHTPTEDELLTIIKPLIPEPIKGDKGDSIKGDKGDTVYVDKIIEKTEVIVEKPIVTEITKEIENKDTGEQIIEKINTDKTTLIKKEKVEGLKQLEERIIAVGESSCKGGGPVGKIIAGANIIVTPRGTDTIISSTASGSGGLTNPVDYIQYDTGYTTTGSEVVGTTFWDTDAHTLATKLENGVTLQHGQEMHMWAKNTSGAIIPNGTAVSITSTGGSFTTIAPTDITNEVSAKAFVGVTTQTFAINAFGYYTTFGLVHDLNTIAFTEGQVLYVDETTPGLIVSNLPATPDYYVCVVGRVEYSHAIQGRINIQPIVYPKINDLSGVNGTDLTTTGQIPTYIANSVTPNDGYFDFAVNILTNTQISPFEGRPSGSIFTKGAGNTLESGGSNFTAGFHSGLNLSSGLGNLMLGGENTGFSATTGSYNVLLGSNTGYNHFSGSNNIIIGSYVDTPLPNGNGQLNIGNVLYGTGLYTTAAPSATPVATGKIGIGTSTPSQKLHIYQNTAANLYQTIENANVGYNSAFDLKSVNDYFLQSIGNLGISPGAFGIYDNTNSAYRLLITSGGNVGIGTTNPSSGKLQVESSTDIAGAFIRSANTTYDLVRLRSSSAVGYSSIGFEDETGAKVGGFGYSNSAGGTIGQRIYFYGTTKDLIFSTDNGTTADFIIKNTTKNVGVGTIDPVFQTHIKKAATGLGGQLVLQNRTEAVGNYTGIGFSTAGADTAQYQKGGIYYSSLSTQYGRGDMVFVQNALANSTNADLTNIVMTLTNTGNLGIGATPTSTLQVAGSVAFKYIAKTANYTADITDYLVDCTANSFTVTLPTAVGITGRIYVIKNSGTGSIVVDGATTETIDGQLTQTLSQYDSLTIMSNNVGWIII